MAKLVNFPSTHTTLSGGKHKAANYLKSSSSSEETGTIKIGEVPTAKNKIIIAIPRNSP